MSSPPVSNNTALLIPQPQRLTTARSSADGVAASGVGSPPVQAPAENSEFTFSVDSLNVTATKVRLMERAGKEFGIDQADYESVFSYGSAVKNAVEALKRQSPTTIAEIERQLGLDQLGISLDTLVAAIVDPRGSDGDRLDAALEKHLGEIAGDEAASAQPDEIGLYGG
ncbi:hypothetical protein RFM26_24455 [Mesorhizobium sp. VK23B]|uniref:Uncharacterized protein n=1 Tax=Mesorhizobium dulcispinae TaxID=3072316 RepID=A0ABU4XKT6_9HYPH|nr:MULTISPECIES: hypothetical protein [unclassified Mesorhizobium]MDX8468865.1 hypothetical protein [Mesorhizobium sp. VK23B]MDX8475346.1 hypothetical protein [Mesorhizobium sp. VK23A]